MSTYVKMANEKQQCLVGKWNMSSGVGQTQFQHSRGLVVLGIGNTGEIRHDVSLPRERVQTLRGSLAEDTGEKMANEWSRGSENGGDESHSTTEGLDLTEEEIRRKRSWCKDLEGVPA